MTVHDPFDALAFPPERQEPRPRFTRELRGRLLTALDITAFDITALDITALDLEPDPPPTVDLPERKPTMTTSTPSADAPVATVAVPYLTASDAAAALDWYAQAFDAVEEFRVVGDDGTIGHAQFLVGTARFMLSDEHPAMGVVSPTTLGGTGTAIHLTVGDVDTLFARAVAAGATALAEPEDQSHGSRHGSVLDPYGHRWMLSQDLEAFDVETYAEREDVAGSDWSVEVAGTRPDEQVTVADRPGTGGGIWAGVYYDDALAGIRFLVDVFEFEEQIVVTADDGTTVVHSQLRWPEGGIVQAGTHDPGNEFTHPPGAQALYVVTAEPHAVWDRCRDAGLTVIREPESPDYDPDGMGFSVRDPEDNIWSFGSYGLDA